MQNKVISLFAGCGGSSLGYKMAGFKELLAVEWDNNAVETFKLNFPGVPVYHGDITKLSGDECMKLAGISKGELDVLDGSPPCQGFSTAGKRKYNDPRNSLFKEYARLLNDLQPKVFVMENVTGMVKGYMKQAYLQIIKSLRECGYRAKGQVMNAMYYGVCQMRQRVIIIGTRNDLNIEPSHPLPMSKPIPLREKVPDAIASRSERINPWIPASKPCCTITKTPYEGIIRTASGTRALMECELKKLASFPGEFKFAGGVKKAWMRIGNSVPPNLMKAIAIHIKENILSHA